MAKRPGGLPEHWFAIGVLLLCAAINLVSRGIGETFAIFLLPIAREFAADRAVLTSIYSAYMLTVGFISPLVGMFFDRFGPRVCYGVGLGVFALACLLASAATALWQLHALLGVGGAIGAAMVGMLPATTLASRWFSRRLATAMGVLAATMGLGILLFAPLSQTLVGEFGWRGAYRVLGSALAVMAALVLPLPWKRIAAGSDQSVRAKVAAASGAQGWTIPLALKTPVFWALFGIMFWTSISTYAISVQLVAYLVESGVAPLRAASTLGFVGLVSIAGMVVSAALAERIGEVRVAAVSYGSTIAGVAALALVSLVDRSNDYLFIAAFVLLFGTMQGTRGPLVAVLSARHFAGGRQTAIYGTVLFGMGSGGALGSWGSGALYDLTGGYLAGFALSAVGAVCGLLIFLAMPRWASAVAPLRPAAASPGQPPSSR